MLFSTNLPKSPKFFGATDIEKFQKISNSARPFCKDFFRFCVVEELCILLLNFSDGYQFVLRPLYFAYKDREQIVDLLIESLSRLANAASIETKCQITVNARWEKIDSFMTDAVAKNLKVTEYIAVKIQSNYQPIHLLCKSHTVEKLDATNLEVLSNLETSVKQWEAFEKINPSLKSFFRGKKTTVEAGINAM